MSTKRVRISTDSGVTFSTFPGDTADFQSQGTNIKDTVFGQDFESTQTGTIAWTMNANGMYKGFAGYVATIKKSGANVLTTGEATSLLSTSVYQITNPAKQVIDRTQSVVVLDGATDITVQVQSIDYMFGIITLKNTYTVLGAITATYRYLPMSQVAKGNSFTLTQTAAAVDNSDFATLQGNAGFKTMQYGLLTVSLDLQGIYAVTNGWLSALQSRAEVMVEICPDGNNKSICRGIFKPTTEGQSGKVGDLEAETVKLDLSVPDPSIYPLLTTPFSWRHDATTTLSTAIKNALTAWQNKDPTVLFQYLQDGVNGHQGAGVITDISLSGGLDVMNTFALKVSGNGGLTQIGTG